ncbi:uncharacterized protein LOC136081542 [Hydra vulgaris]|uniref:Uncharacterized protein LOC136081542 n=1 Tax=Hydra vulgaris TaxID=6087 RepID=A0ABM4C088_HYDVU
MASQISEDSVSRQSSKRTILNSYFDTINKDGIEKIDKSYARVFFHTGVPFALADSSAWKQHHANLRPAYKPPSSKCISGRLKDALNDEKRSIKEYVNNSEYVSIVTDGFLNINTNHLINYSIHVENRTIKPIAYKIEPTGQEQQTGINIATRIENVILEVGVDKVTSIVTDNALNMRAAWDIIEKKFPKIFCNGCAAHTINLLVKDICLLPEFVDVLEKSRKLTAFVKQRTSLVDQFRIIQNRVKQENNLKKMQALSHAVLTRWYSHHTSVACNLENKLVHLNLVNSGAFTRISLSTKKLEYINIIQDNFFWEDCQRFINVMKPLSKLISKLESDTCLLS